MRSIVPGAIVLLVLAAQTGNAQTPAPAHDMSAQHPEGMKGMDAMMGGPHHVLAMAFRDNLAAFARALQGHVTHSATVNLDLARPAVAEMRRSFDQMQQHHQAQMAMMGDHAKPPMPGAMEHMKNHGTAISEHLTALEAEVNAGTPDPKKIREHATEILKQSAGMSAMPAKPKPM